jgi:hypothetical protein
MELAFFPLVVMMNSRQSILIEYKINGVHILRVLICESKRTKRIHRL